MATQQPIELYGWGTTNPKKVAIALEECGLPYRLYGIDLGKKQHLSPDYLKINPYGKIPAIVDPQGPDGGPITLVESCAILLYLAEKTKKCIPADGRGRALAVQWLFFQAANVGPFMFMDHTYRHRLSEKHPEAIERFGAECGRIVKELDRRLGEAEYLAGPYSVADVAHVPHVVRHLNENKITGVPNLRRWADAVMARPAVKKGMAIFS
ncbi:MAG: glutathione S-transferase N-terminal domain-containing protein [Proteobacteria bacterium]|nr:glutathione S-transferase N-terminal domain-containing protein [Pseudomonadota bacterium]